MSPDSASCRSCLGPGDFDGRFLAVWVPDELGHADAQAIVLDHLGLPAYQSRSAHAVPDPPPVRGNPRPALGPRRRDRVAGLPRHRRLNERLAIAAYTRMSAIAGEMGEVELAEALFSPMRRDESAHLGYYRTYARQLSPHLAPGSERSSDPWSCTPTPPSAQAERPTRLPSAAPWPRSSRTPHNPAIAPFVHQIAVELLASPGRRLPPFVVTAIRRCLDHAYGPTSAPALNGPVRVTSILRRVSTRGMSDSISVVAPVVSTTT